MYYPILFVAVAFLGFLAHLLVRRHRRSARQNLDLLLLWLFGVTVGAVGLFAGLGHTTFAQQTAAQTGFPANNPFQWEVGWTDIAIGVLGLICLFRRDFWWPTAIVNAVFLWGATWGHIYQLVVHGNHHPGNSGPVLYADVLVPLLILVLLAVRSRLPEAMNPESAASGAGDLATER